MQQDLSVVYMFNGDDLLHCDRIIFAFVDCNVFGSLPHISEDRDRVAFVCLMVLNLAIMLYFPLR